MGLISTSSLNITPTEIPKIFVKNGITNELGKYLLANPNTADLTLICKNNQTLSAHKCVLASYNKSYFNCLNFSNRTQINLEEYSQSVVSVVRNFLYDVEDSANLEFEELLELTKLTDFLSLNEQYNLCLEAIKKAVFLKQDRCIDAWIYFLQGPIPNKTEN